MQERKSLFAHLIPILMLSGTVAAGANEDLPIYDGIGGDFSAISTLGHDISLSDYRDKIVLLFFGYTSCQDICPAALGHLQSLMSRLESDSEKVQVLFITVDPENDTVEHLKQYLSRFDSRFIGLTGTSHQIAEIAEQFMVKHDNGHGIKVTTAHHKSKTFTDRSFLYAHSQQIYLIDGLGRTRALFFIGSPIGEMETAIRSLLN